jgi:predicted transcriptional regulator
VLTSFVTFAYIAVMPKIAFPVMMAVNVVDQRATADAARRKYKISGLTGNEIAKRMAVHRSYFSDLINGRRDWNDKLIHKFSEVVL